MFAVAPTFATVSIPVYTATKNGIISLGTAVRPRRNEKQSLCNFFLLGGEGGRGGGANKVHYGRCASGV